MHADAWMRVQFAYNEMSFFLIRLLQNFSHIELDLDAQPPDARPPSEWASAEGQKGKEKIIPKCHLTLYVHVSVSLGSVKRWRGDSWDLRAFNRVVFG